MKQGKTQGNLRDFHLDSQSKIPSELPQAQVPQQRIKLKQSPQSPFRPLKSTTPIAEPPKSELNNKILTSSNKTPAEKASPWSLSDFSMASQDEVSLWGSWQQELQSPSISLDSEVPMAAQEQQSSLHQKRENTENQFHEEWLKHKSEVSPDIDWAVDLAQSEREAEKMGVVDYLGSQQKHEILRLRTDEFMHKLAASFRRQVELFNDARKSPAHMVQVYKVNRSKDDFMMFRNGNKLLVSGAQAGRILFGFNQFMGGPLQNAPLPTVEISAVWGPFEQLIWMYKAERVVLEDIVRYFFTEFVRLSFR